MFIDTRLGNLPSRYFNSARDAWMTAPEEVLKCVAFLGVPVPGDETELDCRSTGFFVSGPQAGGGPPRHLYLVTTQHYADKIEGKRFGVRLNFQDGKARTVWMDESVRWWRHPTEAETVDAAVTPFKYPEDVDHRQVPIGMFASDEVLKSATIGAGDEVFMPGLFRRMLGKKNIPIVRVGNIAAIPEDPLSIYFSGQHRESQVYLVEARSMGGLSGSPVFVREAIILHMKRESEWKWGEQVVAHLWGGFYFLGLMHGHWNIDPLEHNRYDFMATTKVDESIALGIAVVVPAKKIWEILSQPELSEQRTAVEREWLERQGGTSAE